MGQFSAAARGAWRDTRLAISVRGPFTHSRRLWWGLCSDIAFHSLFVALPTGKQSIGCSIRHHAGFLHLCPDCHGGVSHPQYGPGMDLDHQRVRLVGIAHFTDDTGWATLMIALLAFIPAALGLAMLALSMPKHYRDLHGKLPARTIQWGLRVTGWVFMILSLAVAIMFEGAAIGAVLWIGLLTVAAQLVALMLTYKDRWWWI